MNYKNNNNYKVISGSDYRKLPFDMRVSYSPTGCDVNHMVGDDNSLTTLAMIGVSLMGGFGGDVTSSPFDAPASTNSFDDLMSGGDFGGGGAGGEW